MAGDSRWVTLESGTHVQIDKDGHIAAGPPHMIGHKPNTIPSKRLRAYADGVKAQKLSEIERLPVLGEGASRKVYDDGDGAIKVAKNAEAIKDNKQEAEMSTRSPLFARITEHSPDYKWVRQEKLHSTDLPELAKTLGISASDQKKKPMIAVKDNWGFDMRPEPRDWLWALVHEANGGPQTIKGGRELVAQLRQIKTTMPEIDLRDFAYVHQWGLDKDRKAKIADFGFRVQEFRIKDPEHKPHTTATGRKVYK